MIRTAVTAWLERSLSLRSSLLLAPLLLWVAADAVVPDLGFARDSVRLAVDVAGWRWPVWGWLPAVSVL